MTAQQRKGVAFVNVSFSFLVGFIVMMGSSLCKIELENRTLIEVCEQKPLVNDGHSNCFGLDRYPIYVWFSWLNILAGRW
jgi:hypothetical protein